MRWGPEILVFFVSFAVALTEEVKDENIRDLMILQAHALQTHLCAVAPEAPVSVRALQADAALMESADSPRSNSTCHQI